MRIKTTIVCLAVAGIMFGSSLAQADEPSYTIEAMTVTANKIEEDIKDVPQSITVIDDEVLNEKGIEDIPSVINEIPNMNYMPSSESQLNFRGLNTSQFTGNHPVVIYIDGVPYTNTYGFDASLVNVERIEVLRGPQSTLYGKDAIGAVIKVVTREPENEWHGNVGTEYGSYNDIQGYFNVNGPLIQDKLYLGLNARYQQDDGWITNNYTGDDDANKSNDRNLGAFLLYKPTDRFSAKLNLTSDYYEHHFTDGYGLPSGADISDFDRDDAEHVSFDQKILKETDNLMQSVRLKYEFDPVTLTSTTTHRELDYESTSDRDYMADTVYDGLTVFSDAETETWTQELKLVSNNTDGVRWVAGLYFDTEEVDKGPYGTQFIRSGSAYEMNAESETESETQAMFGQAMIPFLDNFELTLGARYQRIDKEMDLDMYYDLVGVSSDPYYSLHADENWDVFLPKIALSYQLNDHWTTYASLAQGYMPGGFNYFASSGTEENNTFDPQKSTNYEIGVKAELSRARFSAAIFYMDIKDIHISKYENDVVTTGNADSAHSLGAEMGLTYFLTDSLELTSAIGIIDTEYDDYDTGKVVYDGESITNTPSYTARIGAAYYHPNGFYARGDVMTKGEVPYYNVVSQEFGELDSYITADVKVGYRFNEYDIYAFCDNLTDEEYITSFSARSMASYVTFGDPRTFGIGVRYKF